jgi:peptidoglycan/LPS O-acetylase OafA/YrhL
VQSRGKAPKLAIASDFFLTYRVGMFTNIQALRAFAALNVVLFHAIGAGMAYNMKPQALAPLQGWGANGVDVFFVISGFVMMVAQQQNPKSPGTFLRGRVARIVPVYWAATALMIVLLLALPSQARELGFSLGRAAASFLFVSGPVMGREPLVYVGWTLEYEFAFYLLFTLGIWSGGGRNVVVFLGLAVLAPLGGLIVLEFALGMICAMICRSCQPDSRLACAILAAGAAALAVSILWRPPLDRFILWGMPSFLIVLGAASAPQIRRGISVFLGEASYSIYLVQVFTIPVIYKLVARFVPGIDGDLLALLAVILTAVAGVVTYVAVERPLGRLSAPRRRTRPAPGPQVAAGDRA